MASEHLRTQTQHVLTQHLKVSDSCWIVIKPEISPFYSFDTVILAAQNPMSSAQHSLLSSVREGPCAPHPPSPAGNPSGVRVLPFLMLLGCIVLH